ncbi:MAG: polyphosphate:AMP phosphotransferase [Pseudomonadota bacterium]
MFEAAEIGQSISAKEFKTSERVLWSRLLLLQRKLRKHGRFPVLVDFAGVHGAGKVGMVNALNRWMDPRWISTHAYDAMSDEEQLRPTLWRFWRDLPPRGQIALYLSGRYSQPLRDFVHGKADLAQFEKSLDSIRSFEQALADDGAVVLKIWMHLGRDEQERRLKALENDPLEKWRVTEEDWKNWSLYDKFIAAGEHIIARTSTAQAPWHIVEGTDPAYRSLRAGGIVGDAIERRLRHSKAERLVRKQLDEGAASAEAPGKSDPATPPDDQLTILHNLDLKRRLSKKDYKAQFRQLTSELNQLHYEARQQGISSVMVFEGPDAAGKGGAIRRLVAAFDASSYRVYPIAAPSSEAHAHHYLWRFWHRILPAGKISIFDRSWYGRVLVERVEGFATETEWRRAYAELNDFEACLVEHKILLLKFWVQISSDEQLARFKRREKSPQKSWKLTDEDWRNRARWQEYQQAAHDMIQHTSTMSAPWTLVEGNSKLHARIKIMRTVRDQLSDALAS